MRRAEAGLIMLREVITPIRMILPVLIYFPLLAKTSVRMKRKSNHLSSLMCFVAGAQQSEMRRSARVQDLFCFEFIFNISLGK